MSQKIKTSVEIDGSLSASQIQNATVDTDKFLVSDGGTVKYRTGAEMLSDLGVVTGTANNVQHQVKAGVAINKGQAVYVIDADGTNMIVGLASNNSEATSSKTMGLLNATVSANGFADVITEGLLSGLDTSTAVVGNPVWLGTNGNLIYGLSNKPYAPNHLVFIGIVTRVNANNGEIFVKVQNGFELEELHNVDLQTTAPVNNDILAFEGGTVNLWKNKTIAAVLGYTPYNASNPNGYISSYTETDPTVPSYVKSITSTEKSNWNTAYGWGNHALAGYLTISSAASTYVSLSGSYSNPSWITALAWSKITGAPAFITSYTETDTLATVVSRGSIATSAISVRNGYNIIKSDGVTTGGQLYYDSSINQLYLWNSVAAGYFSIYTNSAERLNISSGGAVTANVDMRAPIFYDSNNTGYYVDPASTSNLNIINASMFNGRITSLYGTSSVVGQVQTSSSINMGIASGNYGYGISTNNIGGLDIMANQSGQPIRFWSGTVNESPTKSADFNGTTVNFYGNTYAPILYDSNDTSYYLNPNGDSRLSRTYIGNYTNYMTLGAWDGVNNRIEAVGQPLFLTSYGGSIKFGYSGSSQMELTTGGTLLVNNQLSLGNTTNTKIKWGGSTSPTLGLPFTGTSNALWLEVNDGDTGGIAIDNDGVTVWGAGDTGYVFRAIDEDVYQAISDVAASTTFYVAQGQNGGGYMRGVFNVTDYLTAGNSVRGPVFYDNNDTSYYGDFNSTGDSAIRVRGGALHGPNPTWGAYLLVGGDGRQNYTNSTTVASVCASNGNLHIDAASGYDTYLNFYDGNTVNFGNGSNSIVSTINNDGSHRPQIIYDYNNTGYYIDPASTSLVNVMQPYYLRRNTYSTGHMEGGQNNIGATDGKTNPIYTIGSSYNPADAALNNMYGLGYSHTNFWGGKTPSWGIYIAEAGSIIATVGNGIWTSGDITAYSDIRVKDNIEVIENALSKIKAIRGVTFTRKDALEENKHKRHTGVIAQEVLQVLPEAVIGDEENMYSVAYGNLAGLFIEAIKEQSLIIEKLTERLDKLENK